MVESIQKAAKQSVTPERQRNTPTPTDVRTNWFMAVTNPDMDSMIGVTATSVMALLLILADWAEMLFSTCWYRRARMTHAPAKHELMPSTNRHAAIVTLMLIIISSIFFTFR